MASHVQVILREDVDKLGRTGELVRVRPGYARNYLLPRGLASVATRGNIQQIEHEKKVALARAAKLQKESEGVAAALREVTVQVKKQAGAEGRLYGSVTAAEVAALLKEKGYEVDRRKITLPEDATKQVGTFEASARIGNGVVATFKVEVVAES